MKHITYSLNDSEIGAILFSLSLLPSLKLEKTEKQARINQTCCISAGRKLMLKDSDIEPNEFRVIFASLQVVQLINNNALDVDCKTKNECLNYLDIVDKLVSAFDVQFS